MSNINWKNEKDNLKKYLEEGRTYKEINEIYGIKNARNRVYKAGLNSLYDPSKRDWEKDRETIENWLEKGLTYREMSIELGCETKYIKEGVKILNLVDKFKPIIKRNGSKLDQHRDEIFKLLDSGVSKSVVAAKFGITCPGLSFYLDEARGSVSGNHNIQKSDKRIYTKICEKCGKSFKTAHRDQKYCSYKCSNERYIVDIPEKDDLLNRMSISSSIDELKEFYKTSKTLISSWFYEYQLDGTNFGIPDYSSISEFDSSWEKRIYNLLESNSSSLGYTNISHNTVLDEECKYIRPLVFDIILEYEQNLKTVIEIQGPTHFKEIYKDADFNYIKIRDEIKYNYCITHDINILYFTYDKSLVDTYDYPHYVYTDENLLLDKLREFSFS